MASIQQDVDSVLSKAMSQSDAQTICDLSLHEILKSYETLTRDLG